tara:strand:- start:8677 stop:9006 length:330 start_codon:yes stop_codon:yes gene_type:complete
MSSSNPPTYHPTNDDFINDPNSMKFTFGSRDDILDNNINSMMDRLEMMTDSVTHSKKKTRALNNLKKFSNNPVRERPIPKNKKKKYATKPKNHSKISKMKNTKDKFGLN